MLQFVSPQTGSIYKLVYIDGTRLVAYRDLGGSYRVRIQAPKKELEGFLKRLDGFAVGATGDDHISRVVEADELPDVVGDVMKAMMELVEG